MSGGAGGGLEAIYDLDEGRVFMSGIQALVRLPLMQRRYDVRRGWKTAGLVSGYRGSPLGGYDQQLWRAARYLKAHDVVFQPGLNEDLAATALWGAQMHTAYGPARVDGVFGIWYGKGPGVDRSGDPFRAGNIIGTSRYGGVLAVAGDDHAAQSSMYPHQTDGIFQSVMMPILQPSNVSEILSLGLSGIALSRASGLWVAMKAIAEVVESATSFVLPDAYPHFVSEGEGLERSHLGWDPSIAWPAQRAELERRLIEVRMPAALAWARLNRLDRPVIAARRGRLCFVTVGKAHNDLMQSLEDLGLAPEVLADAGVSVYKVAMSWPLDSRSLAEFCSGYEEIVVVEEKQPIVEDQIKSAFYARSDMRGTRVLGKSGPAGERLLPATLEFDALLVARVVAARLASLGLHGAVQARLQLLEQRSEMRTRPAHLPVRKPFFCAGCPHNTSTAVPDGSIAGGGIGCHIMALSQPSRKTSTFSQMGGEGAQWIGAAPFSNTEHIFQNIGDGTYQHSGILAIRAAVAAGSNITFKILYNDAVAMTGGQPAEGTLTPTAIARQLSAEGVQQLRLVSDDPDRWRNDPDMASLATVHHRDELDAIQSRIRTVPGVTAIIYEQTCASEKRRRRKRGTESDPARRLYVNPRVCEGCGDCSVQSNCVAIQPLHTREGTKRRIDQSSCNKDFSCEKGFCPSFVVVDAPVLRKPKGNELKALEDAALARMEEPALPVLADSYNIYVAGIGGMGVLTIGAIVGAAAHYDGLDCSVLDFTGLAQKNGAVVSQVRIHPAGHCPGSVRIGSGSLDLLVATDPVVGTMSDSLAKLNRHRTSAVVNMTEVATADFVSERDALIPLPQLRDEVRERVDGRSFELQATRLAEDVFGNALAANTILLGYAWQKGLLPVSRDALVAAITANGAAVEMNLRAFTWGRIAATDPAIVDRLAPKWSGLEPATSGEDAVDSFRRDLVAYQDEAYSNIYQTLMQAVAVAAGALGEPGERFMNAVAKQAYRLMAYKDEYEVARLYSEPAFVDGLSATFSGFRSISVQLAPPLISRSRGNGRPRKIRFGPWVFPLFRLLARLKVLRGTWADPFGRTRERRRERAVRDAYLRAIRQVCSKLDAANVEEACALAELPADIRGFGVVKEAALDAYAQRFPVALQRFGGSPE